MPTYHLSALHLARRQLDASQTAAADDVGTGVMADKVCVGSVFFFSSFVCVCVCVCVCGIPVFAQFPSPHRRSVCVLYSPPPC